MSKLASLAWWKAAGTRAVRTALVIAVPYIPISYLGDVPYVTLASAAGLGAIASLLTSLVGLAEVEGTTQPWYFAILSRVTKTVAQALLAGFGTAVLITDVNWSAIGSMALTAGFGSLVLAVIAKLPEAEEPVAGLTTQTVIINEAGQPVEQTIPIMATVEAVTVPTTRE